MGDATATDGSATPAPSREQPEDLTDLLLSWKSGEAPSEALTRHIYPALRRIAARQLKGSNNASLQVTELVNEAYVRLVSQRSSSWLCRRQFFAVSSRLIRRTLIDHVRERRSQKRGGGAVRIELDELHATAPEVHPELLTLDRALGELAEIDSQAERIVELRYFGGLTIDETAEVLEISRSTVIRSWGFARSWLRAALAGDAAG